MTGFGNVRPSISLEKSASSVARVRVWNGITETRPRSGPATPGRIVVRSWKLSWPNATCFAASAIARLPQLNELNPLGTVPTQDTHVDADVEIVDMRTQSICANGAQHLGGLDETAILD